MIRIIGCGNFLRGDDGVGAYALKAMEKSGMPDGVELIEAGTRSLDILAYVEDSDKVVIIDAVMTGNRPGTIYRIPVDKVQSSLPNNLNLHDVNLQDIVTLSRIILGDELTGRVILFGIEVNNMQTRLGLSVEVAQAIPRLVNMVKEELGGAW